MAESLSSIQMDQLTAQEDACTLSCLGMGGCAFQVQSTYTGTITFEGTVDGGLWAALQVVSIGDAEAVATTTTSTGIFVASCAGLQQVRARMSALSNGYATVTIRAVVSAPSLPILPASS